MPYILRCLPHVIASHIGFPLFHRPTPKKKLSYIHFLLINLKNVYGLLCKLSVTWLIFLVKAIDAYLLECAAETDLIPYIPTSWCPTRPRSGAQLTD